MTKASIRASVTAMSASLTVVLSSDGGASGGRYPNSPFMDVTRERAWETLTPVHPKRRRSAGTRSRSRPRSAVYARELRRGRGILARNGAPARLRLRDPHPTLDEHPQDGAPILREEGYPEELIEAVLSHAEHLSDAARHPG